MDISIQKYGGSSLADDTQVAAIARRVRRVRGEGTAVVVVVSARGDTTDHLVRSATAVSPAPDPRETDKLLATGELASAALLAIALRELGVPAVSLSGPDAGLRAVGRPGAGVIASIEVEHVRFWLDRGHVVVVAGFQALDRNGELVTLGRGGSDTSAVALAVAHGAAVCEIYTDVPGVRRADPRVVPGAGLLHRLPAEVMAEMAFSGARVLHPRSVELAAAHGIDIVVRDASGRGRGSTITGRGAAMLDSDVLEGRAGVVAVTHDERVTQVVVDAECDLVGGSARVLDALARQEIAVDSAMWWSQPGGALRVSLCVADDAVEAAVRAIEDELRAHDCAMTLREDLGRVAVVGTGLLSRPGLTALALSSLAAEGIPAECVSCSQARTTFLVPRDRVHDAVRTLYHRFGLARADTDTPAVPA
ncbi:aspartate kinase [Saccharothrix longispora]|uniref:Aspartokinase n=1 Tax=Saccharothrix longispora TaxID=33920 RepID=A0ABU1PQX1_9PSEU|nr:aspartate kinase [Saccharothrix longispora]MDR6592991.1 aspartate kinase [Saccharothrix longispora]